MMKRKIKVTENVETEINKKIKKKKKKLSIKGKIILLLFLR